MNLNKIILGLCIVLFCVIIGEIFLITAKNPVTIPFLPHTQYPRTIPVPSVIPSKGITDLPPGRVLQSPTSFILIAYLIDVIKDSSGNTLATIAFYPNGVQGKTITQKILLATNTQQLNFVQQTLHTYMQYPDKNGKNGPAYSILSNSQAAQKSQAFVGSDITLSFIYDNPKITDAKSLVYKEISCNKEFLSYLTTFSTPISCTPYAFSVNVYAGK